MGITNKQRAFIEEYLRCWNASEAATRVGYSERTSRQQGSRLLSNANISAEISTAISERAMSADEVLKRLADMARGDMGDFIDIGSMTFSIDLNKAKELGLTKLIKKVKDRVVMTSNKDGEETETHTLELELYDAQAALVQLGRHHSLFTDKTEITGAEGGAIHVKVSGLDD